MKNFKVMADGIPTPVSDASWQSEELKQKLDSNKEVFIGVAWKRSVTDVDDGYWEKGMTTVPLAAYMLNDKTTYQKVKEQYTVVPEKLRTLDHGRPWSDDQFASTRLSSNRDMSR